MSEAKTLKEVADEDKWYLCAVVAVLATVYFGVVKTMAAQWLDDPNYSHGALIPVITAWQLYERRRELLETRVNPSNFGLLVVFFALAMLVAGHAVLENFTMRMSLVVLVCGLTVYLFGWRVFAKCSFPLLFLFFMVPLPYVLYNALSLPLKLLVTKYSVGALKLMGVPVIREGNIIMFPQLTLEVADACSGLRSLMSLFALGAAYVGITDMPNSRRVILMALILPIALFTNAVRVVATGLLATNLGAWAAEGYFHEFAGLTVFVMAGAMLLLSSSLLKRFAK